MYASERTTQTIMSRIYASELQRYGPTERAVTLWGHEIACLFPFGDMKMLTLFANMCCAHMQDKRRRNDFASTEVGEVKGGRVTQQAFDEKDSGISNAAMPGGSREEKVAFAPLQTQ